MKNKDNMNEKYCDVLDVAVYVINRCRTIGRPIEHLKLHPILYYIHGGFLAKYGSPLFVSHMENRWYGTVYPIVYYKYRKYGIYKLDADYVDLDINKEHKDFFESYHR